MVALKTLHDLPDSIRSPVFAIDALFDEIFLVGGAVRDCLLGVQTHDLDFAVPNDVDDIEGKLQASNIFRIYEKGRGFGTVSARIGEYDVQITSYRTERYEAGSRKPYVKNIVDIDSDLARRDFTINAIAISRDECIDPYDGVRDIDHKTIRAIGDPLDRFRDDPLRIIRAFRLVSNLGFEVDEKTLLSAIELKENLAIISQERLGQELQKIIQGRYWADALNEMADSTIMSVLLKNLGLSYEVGLNDIAHEFEKYSTNTLESMNLAARWCYLISIIYYVARSSGVVSTSIQSIAETLINSAQLEKGLKKQVIELLPHAKEETEIPRHSHANVDPQMLVEMQESYMELKKQDNPRWMIEGAKYFTEVGRQALFADKFAQAKNAFTEAVHTTEESYAYILSWHDQEKKVQKLRALKPHFLSRVRYLYIALILDGKLFEKFRTTDDISDYLMKNHAVGHVGRQDILSVIDRAIAHVYKSAPHHMTVESFNAFLSKQGLALPDVDRERYLIDYINLQLKNKSLSPKERMDLYFQKMRIVSQGRNEDELGLEFYDPKIDYLYNKMLISSSLVDFHTVYEEYQELTPKYQKLMDKQGSGWAGRRNINLTAASGFIFALTLASDIDDKISISNSIVELYNDSGSKLNAGRYSIYRDWFSYVKVLISLEYTEDSAHMLIRHLRLYKSSIKYTDVDEEYLYEKRPDIVHRRDFLRDSLAFAALLSDQKIADLSTTDKNISALQVLVDNDAITKKDAFYIYKNVISKEENQAITLVDIEPADRSLDQDWEEEFTKLLRGEGETLEYKASWRFNLDRYKASQNKDKISDKNITKSAVKNIAGLMNKKGGVLLIGVEDDANVIGLENTDFLLSSSKDVRKSLDNLQQSMRVDIINSLGKDIYHKLEIEVLKYKRKNTVIKITVPLADPARPALYLDDGHEIYYVRSGTTCENAGIQAAIDRMRE